MKIEAARIEKSRGMEDFRRAKDSKKAKPDFSKLSVFLNYCDP